MREDELPTQVAAAVIYAKDMLRISRFYEAIAGFSVVEEAPGHVVLEARGFQLTVVAVPAHIAVAIDVADPPVRREAMPVKLVYFVSSIPLARDRVAALGGRMNSKAREWQFHGTRVCDGSDPEGNMFQLRENARVTPP